MRITTISYGRTLSDKDYGSFRSELTAELESGDDVQKSLNSLKEMVLRNVNEQILASGEAPEAQQELPVAKATLEVTEQAPGAVEEVTKKPAKKVTKKVAKKVAKKTTKKATHVVYDRTLQPHKTMFLAMAAELGLRDGKEPEDKTALKETSEFMEGQEMFETGSTEILEAFKVMAAFQFKDFKAQAQVAV